VIYSGGGMNPAFHYSKHSKLGGTIHAVKSGGFHMPNGR
jgi:hypothetical protein